MVKLYGIHGTEATEIIFVWLVVTMPASIGTIHHNKSIEQYPWYLETPTNIPMTSRHRGNVPGNNVEWAKMLHGFEELSPELMQHAEVAVVAIFKPSNRRGEIALVCKPWPKVRSLKTLDTII